MPGFRAANRVARRALVRRAKDVLVFRGGAPVAPGDTILGRAVVSVADYASLDALFAAVAWRRITPYHSTPEFARAYLGLSLKLPPGGAVRAATLAI